MRNKLRKAFGLMLAFCLTASNLPYMEKAKTVHEENVVSYEESGDIVRGFGNKIKEKKQKKEKFKVNKEDKKGKAWNQRMIQAELPETADEVIKVAIIDSGINFSTDLNVVERKNFIPDDECLVLYEDISGHGTAVAGIIGALDNEEGITGINPGVELYSARVLDDKLEAPVERIVEAIDWAIEQDVDIINMSFGIEKNVAKLETAIERAAEAGILLVAASGDGDKVAYPAAYDEVIAVGSLNAAGTPAANSAGGDALELMAPGENILSSGIFDGVMGSSGTSMAAPHVVGAASVLMELNPNMPAEYIRALLNYSANLYGDSDEYGNGVVDLEYAIEINDKFQKLYEKHLKKTSKNKKEKAKQKEKFWGEVLKTIPENEKAVETFTEVEVVEGMWYNTRENTPGHYELVDYGESQHTYVFSKEQLSIMMYASKYVDNTAGFEGMKANPYHGYYRREKEGVIYEANYVANYILLTKIANVYGTVNDLEDDKDKIETKIEKLFQEAKSYMKGYEVDLKLMEEDFADPAIGLGTSDWETIFSSIKLGGGRTVPDPAPEPTPENVRYFVYGMALHALTDVYAHSAFVLQDGTWVSLEHNKKIFSKCCDNPKVVPERWSAAQRAASSLMAKMYNYMDGSDLLEFTFFGSNPFGTFYLANLSTYAKEASSNHYKSLKQYLDRGDLWLNVKDKSIIKFD